MTEDNTPPNQPILTPVRWTACLGISLPLVVLNAGWIANSEIRSDITEVTISTLFMGVTFILFLVTLGNLLCRRLWPKRSLNQPELMIVYTLLSISSVVAGVGHIGFFTPYLTAPFWYATTANGWRGFWYLLPSYIGPRDPQVLKGFYLGHSSFFQHDVMAAWAMPLLVWGVFFLILLWTTLCLAAMLRRRWAEEEHLPFPVIALPLEMTREGAPLYRNWLLWAGFAVPAFMHSLNSLQSINPTLPYLHISTLHDAVTDVPLQLPWTGMDTLFYLAHGSGLGFGYLINTDVSFSLWFFYLLKKVLNVWGVVENWRDPSHGWFGDDAAQFPYTGYQGLGAWLALGLTTLWAGRAYFRDFLRRAWTGKGAIDSEEAMTARTALVGFAVGFLALCAFVWSSGGSWWLPVAFLGIYLLLMVALSRIRAETAVLSTELIWVNPQTMLPLLTGTESLSRMDLAHMGMLSWFNTDYRAAAMPHELEGLVGLGRAKGRLRPLIGAILLTAAVAIIAAMVWDLQMYYVNGADTAKVNLWRVTSKGEEPWRDLQNWLTHPKPPDGVGIGAMAVGFGVTFLLSAMRQKFMGFPLHPAAYVLNTSFANDFFWCDMFLAWLIKTLVLRYGGMALYRRALPFFLGLILGDFVVGSAWSIIGPCCTSAFIARLRSDAVSRLTKAGGPMSSADERVGASHVAGTDFRPPRLHLPTLRLWNALLPFVLRRFCDVASVSIPQEDLERLKSLRAERVLLTPNHPTNTDPALLFALARAANMPFHYLACRETFDGLWGCWGRIIERLGAYSVVRGTADRESFRMTRQLLTQVGGKVVIFPEGEVYSENDSLLPFQTGVAQLGFWALEDLRKSGEMDASVFLLPVAVRYQFVQDMTEPIRRSLSGLEDALRLTPMPGVRDDYSRLRRIGVTMLGNMEAEYGLKPAADGDENLSPRMFAVKSVLLDRAAALLGVSLPTTATLPERMRLLMNSVYAVTHEEQSEARTPYRERLHRQQAARVAPLMLDLNRVANWIAVQDNYVRAHPTPERMADNLRRLEAEAFGAARLRGLSRAIVRSGEPIRLASFSEAYKADKRATVARVTHDLETAVQELLDIGLD